MLAAKTNQPSIIIYFVMIIVLFRHLAEERRKKSIPSCDLLATRLDRRSRINLVVSHGVVINVLQINVVLLLEIVFRAIEKRVREV